MYYARILLKLEPGRKEQAFQIFEASGKKTRNQRWALAYLNICRKSRDHKSVIVPIISPRLDTWPECWVLGPGEESPDRWRVMVPAECLGTESAQCWHPPPARDLTSHSGASHLRWVMSYRDSCVTQPWPWITSLLSTTSRECSVSLLRQQVLWFVTHNLSARVILFITKVKGPFMLNYSLSKMLLRHGHSVSVAWLASDPN